MLGQSCSNDKTCLDLLNVSPRREEVITATTAAMAEISNSIVREDAVSEQEKEETQ